MKGLECQARWFGTCVGSSREPLEFPGGGTAVVREVLPEESSGQRPRCGLKRGESKHSEAGKPGRRGQGPECTGHRQNTVMRRK